MEFLRFGSSIPGTYWGCCAMCIIQNFKFDPDAKSSIQLVSGDGGGPLVNSNNQTLFVGPTYRDIFKQRIRIGTFSNQDMPNHGFLAVLTQYQIDSGHGKKWMEILKEEGFEFIRTVDNSVYTGPSIAGNRSPHPNHLFGLFRNIGAGRVKDPFTPPKGWTDLPDPYSGDMSEENMRKIQTDRWIANGPTKFMTEAEVVAAGAPVVLAGLRSKFPQQTKESRDVVMKAGSQSKSKTKVDAFPMAEMVA